MVDAVLIPLSPTRLRRLERAVHLTFMSQLLDILKTYETTDAEYLAHIREFEEAFHQESVLFGQPRGSEYSGCLTQADAIRVRLYRVFRHTVRAYAECPSLPECQSARVLLRLLCAINVDLHASFRKRCGAFTALLHALEEEENRVAVAQMHLSHMVEQIQQYSGEAVYLLNARNKEHSLRVPKGLSKACAHTDRVCIKCLRFVSSMCVYLKDKVLVDVIARLNQEIKSLITAGKMRKRYANEGNDGDSELVEVGVDAEANKEATDRVRELQLVNSGAATGNSASTQG